MVPHGVLCYPEDLPLAHRCARVLLPGQLFVLTHVLTHRVQRRTKQQTES